MNSIKLILMFVAVTAVQISTAYAGNISLRVAYSDGRQGTTFTPVHAELGEFALTPGMADGGQNEKWRVVAKNAQGTVLHEVLLRNAQQRHIEVFDPKTGAIEVSQQVRQADGVFEVSLPFDEKVVSIEIQQQAAGNSRIALAPPQPTIFDRASLEKMARSIQAARVQAPPPAATVTTIINNGPSNARMDLVFVGDGYTTAEMSKWHTDAQKVIDGFMADPLFAANRASINVHRVDVASNQSGADEPDKGIYRDTAMDGSFYCYNIDRLLCVNSDKVYSIVGSVLSPDQRDVIVVVSNSTRYGGSGGEIATLSMHAQSVEIALHEIGHTAFALADEYDYGTCSLNAEPTSGDVSLNGTRSVKWGSLISSSTAVPTGLGQYPNGTVGVFQGAQYCKTGKYRPTENSRMRTLGYPWHAVNEGLARTVFASYAPSPGGQITQTGSLVSGATANAPSASPGYVQAGNGTYSIQLTGPAGTDFDLYLYKYSGSAWTKVASSEGSTSTEAINYAGTAGYYYVQVKSYSGSGNYTVTYSFPPK
ncbi:M64 family metallopeptidase [Undibacterium sp. TS12]|uniref:M64 family metallopeptidase n=1 Tax=Undibacterium sp. TS12 TaxID=2908202 RepID=UPI001F4C9A5C|nr:M64 family metallopeptidase [Undibacterium sp. TS12]MCH8621753.1 M64 family metallo-endopeptidase [Undibacterium sp. TS12]